jgi:hypothetical protein
MCNYLNYFVKTSNKSLFSQKFYLQLSRYSHAGNKGESRYSSYSFSTSALDGVRGQGQTPAKL